MKENQLISILATIKDKHPSLDMGELGEDIAKTLEVDTGRIRAVVGWFLYEWRKK